MLKRSFACLALATLVMTVPASAAPRSPTEEADSQLQAFGVWMQRLTAAMAPMNEAAARFAAQMQQNPPRGEDPAERAVQVARIRTMIAEVRRATEESRSQLARIPKFEGQLPGGPHPDFNRILTDVQGETGRMLDYMDDTEAFAAALVQGDPTATRKAAAKLIRGGFLLIDSQAILTRGRQLLIPRDRSGHQLVGVGLQLYRAMSVAGHSWYRARAEGDPKGGALTQRTRFLELADELEAQLREGRANFARENAMLASQKSRAAKDPDLARILTRVEGVTKSYLEVFTMGDELVAWLRARAETPGAALAAQPGPDFILQLSAFEQRLQRFVAEVADSVARE
jgi:hypothetical protein